MPVAHVRGLPNPSRGAGVAAPAVALERDITPLTRWAFYAWMFSLPFEVIIPDWLPDILRGSFSIPRMVGLALAFCFLIDPTLRPWRLPPAALAFIAFFVIFTISMLRHDFTNFLRVFQQLQLCALFLIGYNIFLTGRATRGALLSYAFACGAAATMILTGIAQGDMPEWMTEGREYAFGADPNLYGKILLVGTLAAIGTAHVRRDKRFAYLLILWIIAVLCMICIGRSASRGTTLALAVGLGAFVLRKGSIAVRLGSLGVLAGVACVAFWIMSRSEVLMNRWHELFERGNIHRVEIFEEAWEMVRDRPLIGWGPAATTELADRLHSPAAGRSTHNIILAMLTLTGLIGSIPFFWGYCKTFYSSWLSRRGREDILPLAIFLSLFAADMIAGGLPVKLHWTFFAYILAAGKLTTMASRTRMT